MSSKIFRLLQKHQRIDTALRAELARRFPDAIRAQRLKKLKLAVKDALFALTARGKPLADR